MIKKEELLRYKPDYYDGVYEMEELLKAEGEALSKFDAKRYRILLNYFVMQTDEKGISIFESELGIEPEPGDTLLQRQRRVLTRKLPPHPITRRYLQHLIELAGIPNEVLVDYAKRMAYVEVNKSGATGSEWREILYMLNVYLPANMGYQVRLAVLSALKVYVGLFIGETDKYWLEGDQNLVVHLHRKTSETAHVAVHTGETDKYRLDGDQDLLVHLHRQADIAKHVAVNTGATDKYRLKSAPNSVIHLHRKTENTLGAASHLLCMDSYSLGRPVMPKIEASESFTATAYTGSLLTQKQRREV